MFSIFKKQEQKYIEPSELITYDKIRKVISSCKTIQQLSFVRIWMMSIYNTYNWECYGIYFNHLYAIYDAKWDEILEKQNKL